MANIMIHSGNYYARIEKLVRDNVRLHNVRFIIIQLKKRFLPQKIIYTEIDAYVYT